MFIATDILLDGFFDLKTFILRSMLPTLSFCAEPKAKSQNLSFQKVLFPRVSGGIVLKDSSPSAREVIFHLKESIMGERGTLAVGHGEDTIKGIFPKRAEKI